MWRNPQETEDLEKSLKNFIFCAVKVFCMYKILNKQNKGSQNKIKQIVNSICQGIILNFVVMGGVVRILPLSEISRIIGCISMELVRVLAQLLWRHRKRYGIVMNMSR